MNYRDIIFSQLRAGYTKAAGDQTKTAEFGRKMLAYASFTNMNCCGMWEADIANSGFELKVGQFLCKAVWNNKAFIVFSTRDDLKDYDRWRETLASLPNCVEVGAETNPNTGHPIRVWVLNLMKNLTPDQEVYVQKLIADLG